MGGKRIRGLKMRGVQVLHLQKGARLSNEGIPDGGVRGKRHSDGRCRISKKAGREDPGVRAAKSSESRKGE